MGKDITIIMPTLDEAKYIRRTLESIRKQDTAFSYEVILGDSYSKDGTLDIAGEYGCRVVSVPPGNIALGRNAAADAGAGEIIVSADADTVYAHDWLRNLTQPIFEGKVVGTAGKILPYKGTMSEKLFSEFVLHSAAAVLNLDKVRFVAGSNMAVDRDVYMRVGGFNPELKTAEDTDLMHRVTKVGKTKYVPKAVAFMSMRRVHKWGYLKFASFHTENFIKYNVGNKVQEIYEPVR